MRNFDTGATRDVDNNKYDYEGFISPLVLEAYAAYMHKNRFQADGKVRDSDNWQKGIPKDVYMKSAFRHFMDMWKEHRGIPTSEGMEQSIAALMFNIMGYLHETLKEQVKVEETPAWRLEGLEPFMQDHFTHRYGALAHDQVAIEDEASEETWPLVYEDYTPGYHASLSGVPGMEHS